MTYDILKGENAVRTRPVRAIRPAGSDNPNMPSTQQAFEAVLNGLGVCTATVQVVCSNDAAVETGGGNWQVYGAPISLSSLAADLTPGLGALLGSGPWKYFGAYLTALSGTNAAVDLVMSG